MYDGISLGVELAAKGCLPGPLCIMKCVSSPSEILILHCDGQLVTMATDCDVTGLGLQVNWQEQVSV